MFISNNRTSFYLWVKENLVKHRKVSKYYEIDCRKCNHCLIAEFYNDQIAPCVFCKLCINQLYCEKDARVGTAFLFSFLFTNLKQGATKIKDGQSFIDSYNSEYLKFDF